MMDRLPLTHARPFVTLNLLKVKGLLLPALLDSCLMGGSWMLRSHKLPARFSLRSGEASS